MTNIIIKDRTGKIAGSFTGLSDESVGMTAQEEGIDIPFSCGVGACRTCLCTVEKGYEHIDPEAIGPAQIDIDPEAYEILSCIAAMREDTPEDAEIILEAENL